jgi:WD40 repeat protein
MAVFIESNSNAPISSLSFNQDNECFVCACKSGGFRLFNADPLRQVQSEEDVGRLSVVEMLYRCNYVAFVGEGSHPAFPPNKVVVYDCTLRKVVIELQMSSDVAALRLQRDRIVICLSSSIHIYTFMDIPKQLTVIETWRNPGGICALASSTECSLLAFPSSTSAGVIGIGDMRWIDRTPLTINAHTHPIAAISFNSAGSLMASASTRGTLIRLFDVQSRQLIREFRRGTSPARITCLCFSMDSHWLCVSSNRPTIHVFVVNSKGNKPKRMERYLKGEVSVIRLRLSLSQKYGVTCQCAFNKTDSIIAVCSEGSYYKFQYDRASGSFIQQKYCLLTEFHND